MVSVLQWRLTVAVWDTFALPSLSRSSAALLPWQVHIPTAQSTLNYLLLALLLVWKRVAKGPIKLQVRCFSALLASSWLRACMVATACLRVAGRSLEVRHALHR